MTAKSTGRLGSGGAGWVRRYRTPLVWGAGIMVGVLAPVVVVIAQAQVGSAAGAETDLIVCTAYSGSGTVNPGINQTSTNIKMTGSATVTGCLSTAQPTIVLGAVSWDKIAGHANCSFSPTTGFSGSGDAATDAQHKITVTWKNAVGGTVGTSTIEGSGTVTASASTLVVAGTATVTAGLFNGATVAGIPVTPTGTADPTKCNTNGGVKSGSSTGTALSLALVV